MNHSETWGRAQNFELLLWDVWGQVGDEILRAGTPQEIKAAFEPLPYHRDRLAVDPLPRLMLEAVQERDFPKVRTESQIRFIAESLAGWGTVSPRRSREICRKQRMQAATSEQSEKP